MIDVLIVGAGIGGLCAAQALSRQGLGVRLVERASTPSPAGAGILLAGNAQACLEAWGLLPDLLEQGHLLEEMCISDRAGRVLGRMRRAQAGPPTAMLALHRGQLHDALLSAAQAIPLTTQTTVTAIQALDDGVQATLSSGEELQARLLVGADGVGSNVRSLQPAFSHVQRTYAGYTCWRVVVPDPGLEGGHEMWGRGQRVGLIPLSEGRVYSFLVANAPSGMTTRTTSAEALRKQFSEFGGPARGVLANIDDSTAILHHDIEYLSKHVFHSGRVALLGDAAHALTPNMGQGAAMAIEDAYVLAESLRVHGLTPQALETYGTARRARVQMIAQRSLRMGKVGQWQHPWACTLRDMLLAATPQSVGQSQVRSLIEGGPAHRSMERAP